MLWLLRRFHCRTYGHAAFQEGEGAPGLCSNCEHSVGVCAFHSVQPRRRTAAAVVASAIRDWSREDQEQRIAASSSFVVFPPTRAALSVGGSL